MLTDTIYKNQGIYGWIKEANLTGSSNGWEWFELYAGGVDEFDINYIDTVMFKFTFISDSIENNKEGWMLDDIYIDDFGDSSIDDFKWNNFNSFIFPNPSADFISIKYENSIKSKYKVLIYDSPYSWASY